MDLPEVWPGRTRIVREQCRYISASNRWYFVIFERPIYDDMPERCRLFPTYLHEEEIKEGAGYLLHAEYPDGFREKFTSFEELEYRFSAKRIEVISDTGEQN